MRKLDMNKLKDKVHKIISKEEALRDVIPFEIIYNKEYVKVEKNTEILGHNK